LKGVDEVLLERHYELAREMKLYEKIAIDELSVDDITYYLKLRREYEELQNQVVNLIPSVLEKMRNLLRQAQEKIAELAGSDYLRHNYPFLKELVEVTGELEADVEKVVAGCSRLEEIIRQDQETGFPYTLHQALEEAACAAPPAAAPANPEPQERKNGGEQKVAVSPDTIKKIEMMVKPRETSGKSWAPLEEKQNEKVIKINAPPEPKKHPPKNNKDKGKR
jgi:hypothetical protein